MLPLAARSWARPMFRTKVPVVGESEADFLGALSPLDDLAQVQGEGLGGETDAVHDGGGEGGNKLGGHHRSELARVVGEDARFIHVIREIGRSGAHRRGASRAYRSVCHGTEVVAACRWVCCEYQDLGRGCLRRFLVSVAPGFPSSVLRMK